MKLIKLAGVAAVIGAASVAQAAGNGSTPNGKPFIAINDQIIEVKGAISSIEDQLAELVAQASSLEDRVAAN